MYKYQMHAIEGSGSGVAWHTGEEVLVFQSFYVAQHMAFDCSIKGPRGRVEKRVNYEHTTVMDDLFYATRKELEDLYHERYPAEATANVDAELEGEAPQERAGRFVPTVWAAD